MARAGAGALAAAIRKADRMSLQRLAAPQTEPVSVADLRDWLKIDAGDEDATLAALIEAARTTLEGWTRRAFVTQSWRFTYAGSFADGVARLPLAPVVSILDVRLYDAAGAATTLPPESYALETDDQRPGLRLLDPPGGTSATRCVVEAVFGYGPAPADTPAPLRQAILMLASCWHARRGDHADADRAIPVAVSRLVAPYRRAGLR